VARSTPVNQVVIYGNVTADPTVTVMPGGAPVVNFHVSEEHSQGVNFFKCVLVGDRAKRFADRYKAGDHVCVTGRLVSHTVPTGSGESVWWEVWVTSAGDSGLF
jgi:single-stranded DNA-binding protein